jgi:DNA-binding protein HU-beta
MIDRIDKDELARRLAAQMHSDVATATTWLDGVVETLYESFKAGESVTLRGFGSFYVREERSSWVFRFNPGQCLLKRSICGHLERRSPVPANNLQPTVDLLLDRDHRDCDTIISTDLMEALNHSRMGALLE